MIYHGNYSSNGWVYSIFSFQYNILLYFCMILDITIGRMTPLFELNENSFISYHYYMK